MIARPLAFATGVVCVATLLAYGGRWFWLCELLVNFRAHYALVLGLALLLSLGIRLWRLSGIAVLGLAANVWPITGAFLTQPPTPMTASVSLRVVAFNVNMTNHDFPGIARYLDSLEPDIVVIEEVTTGSVGHLVPLLPRLEHHYAAVDEGFRGVLILSRWPLNEARQLMHDGRMFGARVDVDIGDRRVRVHGMHFNWPLWPETAEGRNAQLMLLGRELAQCRGACIAVGDFNTTPWSSHWRDLVKDSGFCDCSAGFGFRPTWPSALPALFRIRIDHCLHNAAVSVADVKVGRAVGSDHLATINDLTLPAAP